MNVKGGSGRVGRKEARGFPTQRRAYGEGQGGRVDLGVKDAGGG